MNKPPPSPQIVEMLMKHMPNSVEVEQAVIGACLLDPMCIAGISEHLRAEHFYADQHRAIWSAVAGMAERGERIDILTVTQEMKRTGSLDSVGGAYGIVQFTNKVASSANVETHVRILEEKHLRRELIRMAQVSLQQAAEESNDILSLLDSTSSAMADLTSGLSRGADPPTMAAVLSDMVDNRDQPLQIRLGLGPLDQCVTAGPGNMIIIGARPSVGKTVSALVIARSIAEQGHNVGLISLEMSKEQLTARVGAAISGVDSNRITVNAVNDAERLQLAQAGTAHGGWLDRIRIDDRATLHANEMFGLFARLRRRHKAEVVVIDYAQLMDASGGTGHEIMSKISKAIKQAGKREGIRPILLSQLKRRDGADENPVISDLRESGQLEADGDIIILLGRKKGEDVIKIDLAKNKFGPIGYWYLRFDLSRQCFGAEVHSMTAPPSIDAQAGWRELPPETDDHTPF